MSRPATGARIGDYRIERELRTEATGVVYEGVHLVLPRRAAVKAARDADKTIAVQMLREACMLEALSHPGVPRDLRVRRARRQAAVGRDRADRRHLARRRRHADRDRRSRDGRARGRPTSSRTRTRAASSTTGSARRSSCSRRERLVAGHACAAGATSSRTTRTLAADPSSDIHALGALAYRALTGSAARCPARPRRRRAPRRRPSSTKLIDDMLAEDSAGRPAAEVRERAEWLGRDARGAPAARRTRPREASAAPARHADSRCGSAGSAGRTLARGANRLHTNPANLVKTRARRLQSARAMRVGNYRIRARGRRRPVRGGARGASPPRAPQDRPRRARLGQAAARRGDARGLHPRGAPAPGHPAALRDRPAATTAGRGSRTRTSTARRSRTCAASLGARRARRARPRRRRHPRARASPRHHPRRPAPRSHRPHRPRVPGLHRRLEHPRARTTRRAAIPSLPRPDARRYARTRARARRSDRRSRRRLRARRDREDERCPPARPPRSSRCSTR